ARAVSVGRKSEFEAFGWDPDSIPDPEKRETFERSKLNWDERAGAQHAEMLQWYRGLIRLRRTTPCLNNGEPGNVLVTFDEREMWLRMVRGEIEVIANLGGADRSFEVRAESELELAS